VTQDVFPVNLVVEQIEAEARLRLRLTIQLPLKGPDRYRCLVFARLIANHLSLTIVKSAPEVRALCSPELPVRYQRRIDRCRCDRAMAKPSEDRGIRPLFGEGMATRQHVPERQLSHKPTLAATTVRS
jgi:hypothetical protein